MARKGSLAARLQDVEARQTPRGAFLDEVRGNMTKGDTSTVSVPEKQQSRIGKKALTFQVSPDLARAFKLLAVEESRSQQELGIEALNALLRAYGRSPVGE